MRDVKLRNILMSSDRRMIKLCDFDFSKVRPGIPLSFTSTLG